VADMRSWHGMVYWFIIRAGLRHVRGVQPNRAAKFRGGAILDPTKIKLPVMACILVNSLKLVPPDVRF